MNRPACASHDTKLAPVSDLRLEAPGANVPAQSNEFALDTARAARVKAVAREFAGSFLTIDIHNPEFDRLLRQITSIGNEEVRKLADQARLTLSRNTIRERAVAAINTQLARLRQILDELTPGEDLIKPKKFLGLFPRANQIASYFDRYRNSEADIEAALSTMVESRDLLLRDNVAISGHRALSRPLLEGLAEAIGMCASLDERFEKLSAQLDKSDPAKAQKLRTSALFEVRQRHGDLLTQMAVSQQSYAMLGMIETNNLDLVKGIDRASSTTIAALQTAVVAAQTLANQNLVLDRINGVRSAASSLIDRSGAATADGNHQIDLTGSEAARQVASLRSAFADVVTSVDSLEHQQLSALRSL